MSDYYLAALYTDDVNEFLKEGNALFNLLSEEKRSFTRLEAVAFHKAVAYGVLLFDDASGGQREEIRLLLRSFVRDTFRPDHADAEREGVSSIINDSFPLPEDRRNISVEEVSEDPDQWGNTDGFSSPGGFDEDDEG